MLDNVAKNNIIIVLLYCIVVLLYCSTLISSHNPTHNSELQSSEWQLNETIRYALLLILLEIFKMNSTQYT